MCNLNVRAERAEVLKHTFSLKPVCAEQGLALGIAMFSKSTAREHFLLPKRLKCHGCSRCSTASFYDSKVVICSFYVAILHVFAGV